MTPHLDDVAADATHRCAFRNTCNNFQRLLQDHTAGRSARSAASGKRMGTFSPFSRAHFPSARVLLRCNINVNGTDNVPRATQTLRNSFAVDKEIPHNSPHQNPRVNYSDVICLVVKFICMRLRRCVPPFLYKNGGHTPLRNVYTEVFAGHRIGCFRSTSWRGKRQ